MLLDLLRKLLIGCVVEVKDADLGVLVEDYVEHVNLDRLPVMLHEYRSQVCAWRMMRRGQVVCVARSNSHGCPVFAVLMSFSEA